MKRRSPRTWILALALAPAFAAPALGLEDDHLDFETYAKTFLDDNDLPSDLSFQEVIDGSTFLRVELGSFDLRIPRAQMEERSDGDRVIEAAHTLIKLQKIWYDWRGNENIDPADWTTLDKWVKTWSARKLASCDGGDVSLLVQLSAKEKIVEAATRLSEATNYPESTVKRVGNKNILVLAPNRKNFLEVVAVAGQLTKSKRADLWVDKMIRQGAAWFDWTQIIALENCSFPVDYKHPFNGIPLDESNKTGFNQHIADRGGMLLLRKEFVRQGTHFFEEALGVNLVIATAGENGIFSAEWNISYHTAGGRTEPYTRFVPGGNPSGGVLPPRKATAGPTTISGSIGALEGPYRAGNGDGFFKEQLRNGQKDGAKIASKVKDAPFPKDKRPYFRVTSNETHEQSFVTAPFLGDDAEGKKLPPNDYLDDYEDFFRAYRSSFVEWLKTRGAGSPDASAAMFRQMIQKLATREPGVKIDSIAEEIYGTPFSDTDPATDSLEWRFLDWLANGK